MCSSKILLMGTDLSFSWDIFLLIFQPFKNIKPIFSLPAIDWVCPTSSSWATPDWLHQKERERKRIGQQNRLHLYHSRGISEGWPSRFYSKIAPFGQFGVDNMRGILKELITYSRSHHSCPLTLGPTDKILATVTVLELY